MAFLAQKFRDIYFPYRIFTLLCISFFVGIFIASFTALDFGRSWLIFLYLVSALLMIGLVNCLLQLKFPILLSFSFLALSFGIAYYSHNEWKNSVAVPFNQKMEITGTIITRPEINSRGQKITLQIQAANIDGNATESIRGSKLIVDAPVFPEYHFSQILSVEGEISEPQNFSDFDYKGYLKRAHIIGEMKTPAKVKFRGSSTKPADRFYSTLYNFVDSFEGHLNQALPEPHSSLAAGILLGIKRNISDDLMTDLQKTGLTHIIALSGFNITVLIAVFAGALTKYLGRRYTFIIGLLLVLLFVLMTGASSSVVRAAIFASLILFGKTIGKRADQLNLILLTALVMVAINPYLLAFDLGFQLSFLAFIGLIYLSPVFDIFLTKPKLKFIPIQIKRPLSETLGAQMAVFPLILAKFGVVSIISPLANLLVVWIIPWVMLLVFATGILALITLPLGQAAAVILWPSLEYIIKVVEVLSNLPYSSIKF